MASCWIFSYWSYFVGWAESSRPTTRGRMSSWSVVIVERVVFRGWWASKTRPTLRTTTDYGPTNHYLETGDTKAAFSLAGSWLRSRRAFELFGLHANAACSQVRASSGRPILMHDSP